MQGKDAIFSDFRCGVLRRSKSHVVAIEIGARGICAAESPDILIMMRWVLRVGRVVLRYRLYGPFDRVSTGVGKHCMKAYPRRVRIKTDSAREL